MEVQLEESNRDSRKQQHLHHHPERHLLNMLRIISATAALAASANAVWIAGINISGCDFGVDTEGNFSPPGGSSNCISADEAASQIGHFSNEGFNVFRIPVPWQSLVNNDLTTNQLDTDFMTNSYDPIVNECFKVGAHCIIDIHNYARWYNQIVGQGGPDSSTLAQTWSQLATHYKNDPTAIFGVMNEPHDLDMTTWASTVQDVVTAIRTATGNTDQIILLPGTDYTNAGAFSTQSAPSLSGITNPDGSTTNLIYDVHQYFDGSGTTTACPDDESGTFTNLATYLRGAKRQAMVSELGGGNNAACASTVNAALNVINGAGDVYIGWTSWAAGAFSTGYPLAETPNSDGSDQYLVANAFLPAFKSGQTGS